MTQQEQISYLKKLVEQLKMNEVQIGRNELKSKYPVAYKKLKSEIRKAFCMLYQKKMAGTRVTAEVFKSDKLQEAISVFNKGYAEALFDDYDVEKALAMVDEFRKMLYKDFNAFWFFLEAIGYDEDGNALNIEEYISS